MKLWILAASLVLSQVSAGQQKVQITSREDSVLRKTIKESDFSGTVMVYQSGKPVFNYSTGKVGDNDLKDFSEDVRMNVCSNGKSMTAVLVQQLIEKGQLRPDQTISELLPNEKIQNADKITIQHLLTHTSGLGDFFEHPDYAKADPITTDDFLKLIKEQKLLNDTPGKDFIYSNGGYIVLGKILENYYGKPYQQVVKENILLPLGIDTSLAGKRFATGYTKEKEQWITGEGNDPKKWSAAGGIFLSVNEWHTFTQALVAGKFINSKSLQEIWTSYTRPAGNPDFVGYGRGFMIESPAGLTFIGHNGGIRGFQSAYRYLPDHDMYIYVFSNRDGSAEGVFMGLLRSLITQKEQHGKP